MATFDLARGQLLQESREVRPGGYSSGLGISNQTIVSRTSGWSRGNSTWTTYTIGSLPDLTLQGTGVLANPAMPEAVRQRHIERMGSAVITWGAAGITCWGNRVFIRNNDYLWCIGDPTTGWIAPEKFLP